MAAFQPSTYGRIWVSTEGIGNLPETIADRSIRIRMKRRRKDEAAAKFRLRAVMAEAAPIHEALGKWAENTSFDETKIPEPPAELGDRASDCWEVLLAIADTAGGGWPERARAAARSLHSEGAAAETSIGVRLLADLRVLFTEKNAPRLLTSDMLEWLNDREESPWSAFRGGKGIDGRALGSLTRRYDVKRRDIRIGSVHGKGYRREDLADAWARYLPEPTLPPVPAGTQNYRGHGDNPLESNTYGDSDSSVVTDEKSRKCANSLPCLRYHRSEADSTGTRESGGPDEPAEPDLAERADGSDPERSGRSDSNPPTATQTYLRLEATRRKRALAEVEV